MSDDKLHLAEGRWYGWQMLPGYTDGYEPYFSPIRVLRAEALKTGRGILKLSFWNALYAEGVQQFHLDLKIRTHDAAYLVAELHSPGADVANRSAVISKMSVSWLQRFCPFLVQGPRAELAARGDVNRHLDDLFPS